MNKYREGMSDRYDHEDDNFGKVISFTSSGRRGLCKLLGSYGEDNSTAHGSDSARDINVPTKDDDLLERLCLLLGTETYDFKTLLKALTGRL